MGRCGRGPDLEAAAHVQVPQRHLQLHLHVCALGRLLLLLATAEPKAAKAPTKEPVRTEQWFIPVRRSSTRGFVVRWSEGGTTFLNWRCQEPSEHELVLQPQCCHSDQHNSLSSTPSRSFSLAYW